MRTKRIQGTAACLSEKSVRALALSLALATLLSTAAGATAATKSDVTDGASPETVNAVLADSSSLAREGTYDEYLKKHKDVPNAKDILKVDISNYVTAEGMKAEKLVNYENRSGTSVMTGEEGYIEWTVDVPASAMYQIFLDYYPCEGKKSTINRELLIDGAVPFNEAAYLNFSRIWKDKLPVEQSVDSLGNQIRSQQVEAPEWRTQPLKESNGYYIEPLKFYLTAGKHKIRFVSVKEPMIIGGITLKSISSPKSYKEVLAENIAKGYKETSGQIVKIQGENIYRKSDLSIYATHDRSSIFNESYDGTTFNYNNTMRNIVGGTKWKYPEQWISWKVTVPEDGLYKIGIRGRQNVTRGINATRELTIDGKLPFTEASNLSFIFSEEFKMFTLGGTDEPYLFYLTKGEHTIMLQNMLGKVADLLVRAEETMYELNSAYRRIIMLTSTAPDVNRSYDFEKFMPEVIELFKDQAAKIRKLSEDYYNLTKQRSQEQAMFDRIAKMLENMVYDPELYIPRKLGTLKSEIGTIGTWVLTAREQPFEIDYIALISPDKAMPRENANFFEALIHEIKMFINSFIIDYSMSGSVGTTAKDAVTVWFGAAGVGSGAAAGIEQATVLRQMITDNFMPDHKDTPINLQFISMSALLPATLAGKGPDVALHIGGAEPVNYAMRKAVVDLTQFGSFNTVKERFFPSSLTQFTYEGGVYALPETETFPVMYYRTDILSELGITPPKTWDDVYDIIPKLQKKYMSFGISSGVGTYILMLYQRGGELYKDGGKKSALDTKLNIETFIDWTNLFRAYKVPLAFNFQNRFRSGEMPIGITDYTMYNELSIAAPEIRGLWDFTLVPGTVAKDGSINKTVNCTVSGAIMLSNSKNKEKAWSFMEWWTGTEAQSRYSVEIESLLGTAARYAPANKEVLYRIPWAAKAFKVLIEEMGYTKGVPEVPGSYLTSRHITNCFIRVGVENQDARETILDYVDQINEELTHKRKEYGLDTAEDDAAKTK